MDESLHTYAAFTAAGLAILRPNAELFGFRLVRWYAMCRVVTEYREQNTADSA